MKEEGVEEKEEKRGRSGVVVDFTLRQNIVAGLVGRGWSLGKTRLPVSLIHLTSSSPVNPESDLVVQSVSNYPWIEREREDLLAGGSRLYHRVYGTHILIKSLVQPKTTPEWRNVN